MNMREYVVLEALNIASTIHQRRPVGYQATAAQIAEVLATDDRFSAEALAYPSLLNSRGVGATLAALHAGYPRRRAPLVKRVGSSKWRLTEAALTVLTA